MKKLSLILILFVVGIVAYANSTASKGQTKKQAQAISKEKSVWVENRFQNPERGLVKWNNGLRVNTESAMLDSKVINLNLQNVAASESLLMQNESQEQFQVQKVVQEGYPDSVIRFMGYAKQGSGDMTNMAYRMVSYNVVTPIGGTPKVVSPQAIPSPMDYGALYNGFFVYPRWSAWIGDRMVASFMITDPYGFNLFLYGYGWYEPISGAIEFIGSGNVLNEVANGFEATYDHSSASLYVLGFMGKTLFRGSGLDTNFTFVDTIRINGEPISEEFMTLSCNNEGSLFGIARSGKVYKINGKTAAATLLGPVGLSVTYIEQSATFDRKNNIQWWSGAGYALSMYKVDTNTGAYNTTVNHKMRIMGIVDWYYEKNVPPGVISNYTLLPDPTDYHKVNLSFKTPTLDGNSNAIKGKLKVKISRYDVLSDSFIFIDSVDNVDVGQSISKSYMETADGVYYYAVSVISQNGVSNGLNQKFVHLFNVDFPYTNGFEDSDPKNLEKIGQDTSINIMASGGRTNPACYQLKGYQNAQLLVRGLPGKKGTTYKVSAYVKADRKIANNFVLYVNGAGLTYTIDTAWTLITRTVLVTDNEQFTFGFMSYQALSKFLVDDISAVVVQENTVPSIPTNISSKPSPMGDKSVLLSWENPAVATSDAALGELGGVIVRWATDSLFTKNVGFDTLKTTVVGGKITDQKYNLPVAGVYWFRLQAYNSAGLSPYYAYTAGSAWIGLDTVPATPVCNPAIPQSDGSIKFNWAPITTGVNGGYIPGSLAYRIIQSDGFKIDTIYQTSNQFATPSLANGFYTFSVATQRDSKYYGASASVTSIGGASEKMKIVVNTGGVSGTSITPFAVNSNNQTHISQYLFRPQEVGSPCFIDTIFFYVNPSSTTSPKQRMKFYLGYSEDTCFADASAWVSLESMQKVFDDTVEFTKLVRKVAIPVSGFYYDGTKSLVMTSIKPLQIPKNYANVLAYATTTPEVTKRVNYKSAINTANYDTLQGALVDAGSLVNIQSVFAIGKAQNLSRLTGAVIERRLGDSVAHASLQFYKTINSEDVLITTIACDSNGVYDIAYLPQATYKIRVSSEGYMDTVLTYSVLANQTHTLDILVNLAQTIQIKGKIKDLANTYISDAKIIAKAKREFMATSNDQGEYVFPYLYGSTKYQLTITKEGMQSLTMEITPSDRDTTLGDITLKYVAVAVASAKVIQNAEKHAVVEYSPAGTTLRASWGSGTAEDYVLDRLGANGKALTLGMKMTAGDIKSGMVGKGTVLKVGFVPTDTSAQYEIIIAKGGYGVTPVYTKKLMKKECVFGVWNYIDVLANVNLDTINEWWVILKMAEGYTGFPMAVGASAAVAGKGDWTYYNNQWMRLSQLNSQVKGNGCLSLICLKDTLTPKNGYRVYRGKVGQTIDQYTLLTASPITSKTYVDESMASLSYGTYKYAIRTDWYENQLSAPTYTNTLWHNMEFEVNVNIVSNGGVSPKGAKVSLIRPDYTYSALADSSGKVVFPIVDRSTYNVVVSLNYHDTLRKSVVIDDNKTIQIDLIEVIVNPIDLSVQVTGKIAKLMWKYAKLVNPIRHEMYLDGNKVADYTGKSYQYEFLDLSVGTHILGVKTIFASGASELVTKVVEINDVSIEDENTNGFNVFPNPSSGKIEVSLYQSGVLEVLNVSGTKIYSQIVSSGTQAIDLLVYPKGIYFVRFISAQQVQTLKIVLK